MKNGRISSDFIYLFIFVKIMRIKNTKNIMNGMFMTITTLFIFSK
jgi:hypothetical protein